MRSRSTALLLVLALLFLWSGTAATRCLGKQLQRAGSELELTASSAAPSSVCRISAVEPQVAPAQVTHSFAHAITAVPGQVHIARIASPSFAPTHTSPAGLQRLAATHTILRI